MTLNNVNKPNQQIIIVIPREDNVTALKDSYIELEIEAKKTVRDSLADRIKIRSVNLGPIVSLSEFRLTTSNGKH